MKSIGCVLVLLTPLFLGACATAGNQPPGGDDDEFIDAPAGGAFDAPTGGGIDAFVPPGTPDARPPADAFVPPAPIDAATPPGTPDAAPPGGFCLDNSTCAMTDCCFPPGGMGICVPGTQDPIFGCIPD